MTGIIDETTRWRRVTGGDEARWRKAEARWESWAKTVDGAVIVRLDGRAFHTLTRGMEKPFDQRMVDAMSAAALSAAEALPGCALAYWQSDEISLAWANLSPERRVADPGEGLPFGGRVEKLVSVLASAAAVGFVRAFPDAPGTPCFDGRVLVVDDMAGLRRYLAWRVADSRKNAISAAAHAEFGHSALVGVGTRERRAMLEEAGWGGVAPGDAGGDAGKLLSPEDYSGRIITKELHEKVCRIFGKDGRLHEAVAARRRWVTRAATDEVLDEVVAGVAERLGIRWEPAA